MEENQKNIEYQEYDATLEEDPIARMSDDEIQESILEDSGMNKFQLFIARMNEKTWTIVQRVVGFILGIASGVSLFWNGGSNDEGGFSYSLIVAIVIAMLIPNIIEKQGGRRIPKLRVALVIGLAVMIAVYFIYWGGVHDFKMFTRA